MNEVISSIDNREIAIGFWLAVALLLCLVKRDIRGSIGDVLKAMLAPKIVQVFAVAVAYMAIITYILYFFDAWTLQQLKITVLWFLFAGMPTLLNLSKVQEDPRHLKALLVENFTFSILLDFFLNLFKMPLAVEFVFVPICAIIGGMIAVAQGNDEHALAAKFLNGVVALIGSIIFVYEFYKILTDFQSVANLNTARDFAVPILYNMSFIPALWMFAIYASYEFVFTLMELVIPDKGLQWFAKRQLILTLRTDVLSLREWWRRAWSTPLLSRDQVKNSIQQAKIRFGE